jgi:hypothetical protein
MPIAKQQVVLLKIEEQYTMFSIKSIQAGCVKKSNGQQMLLDSS